MAKFTLAVVMSIRSSQKCGVIKQAQRRDIRPDILCYMRGSLDVYLFISPTPVFRDEAFLDVGKKGGGYLTLGGRRRGAPDILRQE